MCEQGLKGEKLAKLGKIVGRNMFENDHELNLGKEIKE